MNTISLCLFGVLVLYAHFLSPIVLCFCYAVVQMCSDLRYLIVAGDPRTF